MKRLAEILRKFPTMIATTSADGSPNLTPAADVVLLNDRTILIAHNEMRRTVENIRNNARGGGIMLLVLDNNFEGFRIRGTAKYYTSGKYFDLVNQYFKNAKTTPLGAIVVDIQKIEEMK